MRNNPGSNAEDLIGVLTSTAFITHPLPASDAQVSHEFHRAGRDGHRPFPIECLRIVILTAHVDAIMIPHALNGSAGRGDHSGRQ